jgi:hypothetical protein
MNSYNGLAGAMFHEQPDNYNSINSMQKIFILWLKHEFRVVTGEDLLNEMMKYKPAKITRIK